MACLSTENSTAVAMALYSKGLGTFLWLAGLYCLINSFSQSKHVFAIVLLIKFKSINGWVMPLHSLTCFSCSVFWLPINCYHTAIAHCLHCYLAFSCIPWKTRAKTNKKQKIYYKILFIKHKSPLKQVYENYQLKHEHT